MADVDEGLLNKTQKARHFFSQFPDASIADCVKETGVSMRTASQAHSDLARTGKVPMGRNNAASPTAKRTATTGLIDDTTMAKLALTSGNDDLLDIDINNLDDESIRKKLLKGIIAIAFRPGIHPDTQLAATQVWAKLKDMARAKELGPGKPKTREDAVARLTELLIAVGPEIAIAAMTAAFNLKEDDDAPTLAQADSSSLPPTSGSPTPQADQGASP